MPDILYGKEIALSIREDIRNKIKQLTEQNNTRQPCLMVIIAGNDGASIYYADLIKKAGAKEGIKVLIEHLKQPDESAMLDIIKNANISEEIDAVLIQLPLPEGIDKNKVFKTLSPRKDADGQTPDNLGSLAVGSKAVYPATAKAVIKILKDNSIELTGKETAIVGRSTTVGLPAALLLIRENATVTVCHTKTKDLRSITQKSDIVIVSAGRPKFITKDYIKENSIVVDVGTNEVEGQMVGDADFEEISKIASITPVIGGVGSITLACLLENAFELYRENFIGKRT